jgi:hypothetical protein
MTHLHLRLLAYWIDRINLRYQLKLPYIHHSLSKIISIMNTQKSVTTNLETEKGETIQIRQYSKPSDVLK